MVVETSRAGDKEGARRGLVMALFSVAIFLIFSIVTPVYQSAREPTIEPMDLQITKGTTKDLLEVSRRDGSKVETDFPKKTALPHDLIHWVVEQELGYSTAFWGRIAEGNQPRDVNQIAKTLGHSSSSRAQTPDQQIVELLHAERIVECFEVDLGSEPTDVGTFRSVLEAACAQSKVDSPYLTDSNIKNIRNELNRLLVEWQDLGVGDSLTLHWS